MLGLEPETSGENSTKSTQETSLNWEQLGQIIDDFSRALGEAGLSATITLAESDSDSSDGVLPGGMSGQKVSRAELGFGFTKEDRETWGDGYEAVLFGAPAPLPEERADMPLGKD